MKKEKNVNPETDILMGMNRVIEIERSRQLRKKQNALTANTFIALLSTVVAVASGIFLSSDGLRANLLQENASVEQINLLQRQVSDLNGRIDGLTPATSSAPGLEMQSMNLRLGQIENRQSSLEMTMDQDPEKAITSILLREKQFTLQQKMEDISAQQSRLSDKFDNLLIALIVAVIGAASIPVIKGLFSINKKSQDIPF